MLRVKDEEGFMSKGRDYQDGTLSEDYSENELELYQQYCAGKYGNTARYLLLLTLTAHFRAT